MKTPWTNYREATAVVVALFSLGLTSALRADVKMPSIFGSHMVLQQEASLPVWGTADAGEKVTVTVGSESAGATADAEGKWMVKLAPLPNGTAPVTMTVAGKNKITFDDVLVGDVWVCSGQSNMEFGMTGAHNFATEGPKANDPQIRLFVAQHKCLLNPADDVVTSGWKVCTPDTVRGFSAVGYFFGRDLRAKLNRPIGLIGTYFGGTPAQSWTSLSGLQKDPELNHYVVIHDTMAAAFPAAMAAYPAKLADYKVALDKWNIAVGNNYTNVVLKAWNDDVAKAKAAGLPPPPRPQPSAPHPPQPPDPNGGGGTPTALFNGMVAPLIPYAIKGAIWYQGESNAGAAADYRILFSRMITDWREKWGEGDFPFLFVQLACFENNNTNGDWPFLRESQLKTLALPNTGMATAVDIGDPMNIHPQDKMDVGARLALAARHVAYGENLVYSGPIYDSMKVEGSAVRVNFTQTGSGLNIGTAPWTPQTVTPLPNTSMVGFEIAGSDKKWVVADAKIDGNTVVVSSAQVAQPVYVRYAWADSPRGNLYNKENLPASPFRTDDTPQATHAAAPQIAPATEKPAPRAPAPMLEAIMSNPTPAPMATPVPKIHKPAFKLPTSPVPATPPGPTPSPTPTPIPPLQGVD